MALTLKQIQSRMVPARSKEGSDIDDQWLEPTSYDKKLKKAMEGEPEMYDQEDHEAENFKAQDTVKKNTRAPLREESVSAPESPSSNKVNILYEEEALDVLDEIMDIIENEDISSYVWEDVVGKLKAVRDCLLRASISEGIEPDFLEEAFKPGSLKLKDKTYVKISKKDAKALNAAVEGTDNKTKMVSSATKTKKDFTEFLEFAHSLDEDLSGAIEDLLSEATIEELEFIADNELNESESWDIIKGGAKMGAITGAHIGKNLGYLGGGAYGASLGAGVAAVNKVIRLRRAKRLRDFELGLVDENGRRIRKQGKHIKEDENNEKESILGTSAPALDSDAKKKKLEEAKKTGGYQLWPGDKKKKFYRGPKDKDGKTETEKYLEKKRAGLSELDFEKDTKAYKTANRDERIRLEKKWGARAAYFKEDIDLIESGRLGGHPANYRNPAEKKPQFAKTESGKKLDSYVITNNSNNIRGSLAKEVGDIVDVKVDTNRFSKMKVIDKVGNRLEVIPLKEEVEQITEVSKKTLRSYIDGAINDQMSLHFNKQTDPKHGKNRRTFSNPNEAFKFTMKRQAGIDRAERALERKESITSLYKRLGVKKDK